MLNINEYQERDCILLPSLLVHNEACFYQLVSLIVLNCIFFDIIHFLSKYPQFYLDQNH